MTALGARTWRVGLEPLNATRARYGLASLGHVWEQLDHARRALAAGVPALVLPMGRDQLDNAARVVARGAGMRLKPSARPRAIEAAVRRLLDEPRHREGARRMAARLQEEARRDEAADDLEGAHAERPVAA